MFTKLKTTALAVVAAAATLLGSGQVWAFETIPPGAVNDGDLYGSITSPDGSCTVEALLYRRVGGVAAVVSLQNPFRLAVAGGTYYAPNPASPTFPSFTASALEACGWQDVVLLSQAGRDAGASTSEAAWQAEDYIGVRWEALNPVTNQQCTYEVALDGVTDTRLILDEACTPVDNDRPSVTLNGPQEPLTSTDPFTVTATFSEAVTGFEEADITVTNGSVVPGSLSGGPAAYTFLVEPTGNGDVTIIVPENVARDQPDQPTGNPNTASNTLVIGNQIVEITQEAIAGFMLGRANNLASNQPGLTRFLMGDGCGAFSANANEAAGSINGCVAEGNVWAEISSSWSGDGSYTLGTIGAHSFINPDLLIGGMVQFDYTDDPANNASGRGWMIGPYFVARVPEQPLYFEGRLLYGQTDNNITPIGTYTDSFETERWLAQLRATGEYQVQNTTLMPLLDFTYTEDSQRTYTDSLGNTIPGQTVSLMQLNAGLDFSQPLPVQSGTLTLTGGLSGIYSATDGGAAAPEFENWRGRTHLGLNYDTGTGATMNVGAFYDGIGTGYESYGARAGFDWRF